MKAVIAREMDVTKSCVTKIVRKVARMRPERSLKNSLGGRRQAGPPSEAFRTWRELSGKSRRSPSSHLSIHTNVIYLI